MIPRRLDGGRLWKRILEGEESGCGDFKSQHQQRCRNVTGMYGLVVLRHRREVLINGVIEAWGQVLVSHCINGCVML